AAMARARPLGIALRLGLALLAVGCAHSAHGIDRPPKPGPTAVMRVLARSAVPGVASTTSDLSMNELAKDAPIHGLASKIASFGYRDGRERTFQGESRHLTLVVSRSLVFGDQSGAESFTAFVHANAAAYFGAGVEVHPLGSGGRSGWMFVPPACACHGSNPAYVG